MINTKKKSFLNYITQTVFFLNKIFTIPQHSEKKASQILIVKVLDENNLDLKIASDG